MPTTMPVGRITPTPVADLQEGQRYYTWLPHTDGQIVRIYTIGETYATTEQGRRLHLHGRRKFARVNPPQAQRDVDLLVVEHEDRAYCIGVGHIVRFTGTDSIFPGDFGLYIATDLVGVRRYVKSFVALDPAPVPEGHTQVRRSTLVRPGVLPGGHVRVVASTLRPEMVGQVVDSYDMYQRDPDSLVVCIRVGNNATQRWHSHVQPDPGLPPYTIVDRLTDSGQEPEGFTVGERVVWTGPESGVYWETNTVYGVVRSVLQVSDGDALTTYVMPDENQFGVSHGGQYVNPSHLVRLSDFVPPDPDSICGVWPCRCVTCAECNTAMSRDGEDTVTTTGYRTRYYHQGCSARCPSCERIVGQYDLVEVDNSETMYCDGCAHSCEDCGEGTLSPHTEVCEECIDGRANGIRGYGHTAPEMWLGGPLPKNKSGHHVGFYIGFELEISSDARSVKALRDWSEEHLGSRNALDPKQDGSVEGFEIATQPMTPEFFESVDWESFMLMLEPDHATFDTSPSREPEGHGLHVHIGRVAFERDDIATAMFTYLLGQGQGEHLERIGRRKATHYCSKVAKPASTALVHRYNATGNGGVQARRLHADGRSYPGRDAINLGPSQTIEIRAFRSTRDADHLRAAVRTVYLAARYISHLRKEINTEGLKAFVSPKALHWDSFVTWVEGVMPEAADALRAPKKEEPRIAESLRAQGGMVNVRPTTTWTTPMGGSYRATVQSMVDTYVTMNRSSNNPF